MERCSGDNSKALYMIHNGKGWEPHCHSCFCEAVDSTVPVKVMSIDAYERMMRDVKQGIAS